jgi:hypothetical protein
MPEYRIRETGAVVTEHEFRELHPATSFPSVITVEMANDFDAEVVLEGPQPATTTPYQFTYRDGVEQIVDKWFTKYSIGPVFTDYTDEDGVVHTATGQELAYKAQKDKEQWKLIREQRNKLLADSDWTQLPDTSADAAVWATYRQALRDITEQSDPFNITWPESM